MPVVIVLYSDIPPMLATKFGSRNTTLMIVSRLMSTLRLLFTIEARASMRLAKMLENTSACFSHWLFSMTRSSRYSTFSGVKPIRAAFAFSFSITTPLEWIALW